MRKRSATTEFLKLCIADALIKLLEKGYTLEEITIQEITATADVSRITYYRNFKSKEDVLNYKLTCLEKNWLENDAPDGMQDLYTITINLFRFILSIRDTAEILFAAHLEHIFMRFLCKFIGVKIIAFYEEFSEPKREDYYITYVTALISYGLYGIVNQWIQNGFLETPEQMSAIFPLQLPEKFQIIKS